MKKYCFILSLILIASISCQFDDHSSPTETQKKIAFRTDAETTLEDGIVGIVSLLYEPVKSLTESEALEVFSSESNLNEFLEEKEIDAETVWGYITSVQESLEELCNTPHFLDQRDRLLS